MIPIPNVIAGVLIGIVNDNWLPRLIAPFIWGIVFCVYTSFFRQNFRDSFLIKMQVSEKKAKLGMSHLQAFYFIEYWTATITSLVLSVITGFISDLIL